MRRQAGSDSEEGRHQTDSEAEADSEAPQHQTRVALARPPRRRVAGSGMPPRAAGSARPRPRLADSERLRTQAEGLARRHRLPAADSERPR
jgi:hypothetical protein